MGNGRDKAASACRRQTPMVARWGLLQVAIDKGRHGEGIGGGDRKIPATSWPKNGREVSKIAAKVGGVVGDDSGGDNRIGLKM